MPDEQGAPPKGGGNKLTKFIKRNKALSAVIGVVGVYVLFKETKKGSGESEGEGEGEGQSPSALPREANDETHEGLDEEIHRVEQEAKEGDRENQEDIEGIENENRGEEGWSAKDPAPDEHPEPTESAPTGEGSDAGRGAGLTIHGKFFAGATNSHISGSGQTDGGKKYIEYTITFPGRQEHWQYFTASGNWKQVKNSATGPGANKPPTGGGGSGGSPTGGGGQSGGGNSAPPQHNANHPDAVNTGNRCVNGGIGGHSAPPGYHLFCEGGWIWRAPNKIGIAPNQPVAPPAPPAPPPSPPSGGGGGGGGGIDGHPNAVKTENRCVNGGVGKHTAPAGYHLFCASDGWIWRAPNGG